MHLPHVPTELLTWSMLNHLLPSKPTALRAWKEGSWALSGSCLCWSQHGGLAVQHSLPITIPRAWSDGCTALSEPTSFVNPLPFSRRSPRPLRNSPRKRKWNICSPDSERDSCGWQSTSGSITFFQSSKHKIFRLTNKNQSPFTNVLCGENYGLSGHKVFFCFSSPQLNPIQALILHIWQGWKNIPTASLPGHLGDQSICAVLWMAVA